jgi:hypothetical protein
VDETSIEGSSAPDLFLRFVVKQRQLIGMAADHAIHPAGRHAAFGQRLLHLEEHVGVHFIPAPAPWLEDAEEARLLHFGNRFGRHVALATHCRARDFSTGIIARARAIRSSALGMRWSRCRHC